VGKAYHLPSSVQEILGGFVSVISGNNPINVGSGVRPCAEKKENFGQGEIRGYNCLTELGKSLLDNFRLGTSYGCRREGGEQGVGKREG